MTELWPSKDMKKVFFVFEGVWSLVVQDGLCLMEGGFCWACEYDVEGDLLVLRLGRIDCPCWCCWRAA